MDPKGFADRAVGFPSFSSALRHPTDDGELATSRLRRRLASEAAERESNSAALKRVRRTIEHHCRAFVEASSTATAGDAHVGGDTLINKVEDVSRGLRGEIQEATAHAGASTLGPEDPPGSPMGNYTVLKRSLQESTRRCDDLQSDMSRQSAANEELVCTLTTAKDTSKRLLEQLRVQGDELNRLTQQRVADEERVAALQRRHRADHEAFQKDVQQRLAVARDNAELRLGAMERSLTDKLRTLGLRLGTVQEEITQLDRFMKESDPRLQLTAFHRTFLTEQSSLIVKVAAYCDRQSSQHGEIEAMARQLAEQLASEAKARQLENTKRTQRQAVLVAERDHLQANATREIGHLSTRLEALSRTLRAERSAALEDETRAGLQGERLLAERDDADAALNDVNREVVRMESSGSAILAETRMRDQSTAELRRQVRECDDAVAAATSGKEHLRQQIAEHLQRTQEVRQAEVAATHVEYDERLSQVRDAGVASIEAARRQVASMEEVLRERNTESQEIQRQLEAQTAEAEAMEQEMETHKARYEAATSARQRIEHDFAEARKEYGRERLKIQASLEQTGPQSAASEVHTRLANERYTEYKRVSTSHAAVFGSRVGALEDLVRDTQRQHAEARNRALETSDAVERAAADCADAQLRARETQEELELQLARRRKEFADERKRLQEQLASERQTALQSMEQSEQRREVQAVSLRQMQDECSVQVFALERDRATAEEQLRSAMEQIKKDHSAQEAHVQTLDRDLGRVRLLLSDSQANLVWVQQEREREQREVAALHERFEDDLKHASGELQAVTAEEASAKASLQSAVAQQQDQSMRLSKEIDTLKQRDSAHHSQSTARLKKMHDDFEAQSQAVQSRARDTMAATRVRFEALTRENQQLRHMIGDQPKVPASASASSLPNASDFASRVRRPSQLEDHIQRLQRHTEELRSDLARNGAHTRSASFGRAAGLNHGVAAVANA